MQGLEGSCGQYWHLAHKREKEEKPHSYHMNTKIFGFVYPRPSSHSDQIFLKKTPLRLQLSISYMHIFWKPPSCVRRAEFPSVCKVFHIELQLMDRPGIAKHKCLAAICGCLKQSSCGAYILYSQVGYLECNKDFELRNEEKLKLHERKGIPLQNRCRKKCI